MRALVGIASQGPGAAERVGEGCRRLAARSHVMAMSRPWWAPAREPEPAGLLVVAEVDIDVPHQAVRPWLWDLEVDGEDEGEEVQVELLAGRQRGRWRWDLDVERDGAWLGPLGDIVSGLNLPGGVTVRDRLLMHPHPGASPWMDAGHGRTMDRPAALEGLHVGRTWETRTPADRPVARRPPTFLP